MFCVRVDAHNDPLEPAFALPDLRLKEYLHAITYPDFIHRSGTVPEPEKPRAGHHADRAINRPLGVAGHVTAGQDIDPLQEPDEPREKDQTAKYFRCCFHSDDYTALASPIAGALILFSSSDSDL